jgi:hypothetical protein
MTAMRRVVAALLIAACASAAPARAGAPFRLDWQNPKEILRYQFVLGG